MSPRTRHLRPAMLLAVVGLLAMCPSTEATPPTFRITSIELKPDGRFDDAVMQACDVTGIVKKAIERHQPQDHRSTVSTTELVLRLDRVARVVGSISGGDYGGTDLGITVLSA